MQTAGSGPSSSPSDVSSKNAAFWNELCGTQLAKSLGVSDSSPASLKRFDDWYFAFYPYLSEHIPFDRLKGRDVLEVGLGYGTVSQRIAEAGANYRGLDIAAGPVAMANHRLEQCGFTPGALQGSILEAPFKDASFDDVVAIGCLHHTGDLKRAIAESRRLLRPGGRLIFMVYYAYSYRRWLGAPALTARYLAAEQKGHRGVVGSSAGRHRAAYDSNAAGEGAPHTDWISVRSLAAFCSDFTSFTAKIENVDNDTLLRFAPPRSRMLDTAFVHRFGLDLYATATR